MLKCITKNACKTDWIRLGSMPSLSEAKRSERLMNAARSLSADECVA